MKKAYTEIIVGIFVCIGIACMAYTSIKLGKVEIFNNSYYPLQASFTSAEGLREDTNVKITGVEVGKVKSIKLEDYQAVVTMFIKKGVEVQDDAIASVKTSGILGAKYIEILPGGSSELLGPNGLILDTEPPFDLITAIKKFAFDDEDDYLLKKDIKDQMSIKNIITISILIAAFLTAGTSLALADGPGELIVAKIDEGLKILNDPELQGMDRFKERKQKIWDVVNSVFDFEETSKRALGRHWIPLSSEERKEFTDAFVKILKNIYLGKTDSYQGQKIEYVRELVRDNRGKVQTNFFTVDEKKIVIDFNMHRINGSWKAYDVVIEGVSIVSNYRTQINSIMSKGSFEDLMEKLLKKSETLIEVE